MKLWYWKIVWNGSVYFKSENEGPSFINSHPGCYAQFIKIGE